MALGDLMASRFSHSSAALVSNHLEECYSSHDDVDLSSQRRDSETASSSYGNATSIAATSMAYLPQTIVLCDLRHDAFEVFPPAGPSDSGLLSKWRPKDRVSFFFHHILFSFLC